MISSKRFDKQMGGYKQDDVENFLRLIAEQTQELVKQKEEAEQKVATLTEKIEQYRDDEDSLRSALIGAQKLGDSVIRESKAKAEYILRDAKVKSDRMMENMQKNVEREQVALIKMQKEVTKFKSRLLTLYKQHLEMISALPDYDEVPPSREEQMENTFNLRKEKEEEPQEEPVNLSQQAQKSGQAKQQNQNQNPPKPVPQKPVPQEHEREQESPMFHASVAVIDESEHEENQSSMQQEEIQIGLGQNLSPNFMSGDTQTYQPTNYITTAQATATSDSKFGPLKFGEGFDVERSQSSGKSLFSKKKHR